MRKSSIVTSTILTMVLALSTSPAMAWDKVYKEGSTATVNGAGFCRGDKKTSIWVGGSSTVYLSGLKCDKIEIHVEGSSTLCMTGTISESMEGLATGSSTVMVFAGFAERDDVSTRSSSTYKKNTAGSFLCGAIGFISQ